MVRAFRGSKQQILNLCAQNNRNVSSYNYFSIGRGNSGSYVIDFYMATNDYVGFNQSGYGVVKYDPYGISFRLTYSNNQWNATNTNWNNRWISNIANSAFIGLNNTNNYTGNYNYNGYAKVYWWVAQWYNPTEYLEYNNIIQNNTHNGNLFTYYLQGDLYSNSRIKIGYIEPNDSYYFEVYLKDNNSNVIKGTSFVTTSQQIYNDSALYIDNDYGVWLNTINLDYSTQYRLEITSYYGTGGNNLYEDIDWYIFLPQNAVISGDSILNFGSGDYSVKDNTIAIVGALEENQQKQQDFLTDSSEVNNELDSFFSGDTDAIVSNLNFPNLNNNYFVVIYNVVSGITDTLQMSGDPYFDVQLHGETPKRIYASDFTTPNGVLKNFVSMALVFGTLYILYLQLSGFITMLNTGHIKDAINQIDDISGYTIYKM